jgi:hypothetical protein
LHLVIFGNFLASTDLLQEIIHHTVERARGAVAVDNVCASGDLERRNTRSDFGKRP